MSRTNVWNLMLRRSVSSRHRGIHRQPAVTRQSFLPRIEILEDRTVLSTWTVTRPADTGDGSLRVAIAAAQSGDQIVFDPSLHGQAITLTSGQLALTKSLDIEGPGADMLAVSGNHQSRVFDISGVVTVTIAGLTITDGMAVEDFGGGGIMNLSSTLTPSHDILSNNQAFGAANQGMGGGAISLRVGATLTVTDSLFTHNQSTGPDGGPGTSGAIYNNGSSLNVSRCVFDHNQAFGGVINGASGGAMRNTNRATAVITDSAFVGNQAIGVGAGGQCEAGGIDILSGSTVTVRRCTFTGNEAVAADGGVVTATSTMVGFGRGGAIYNNGSTLTVEDSTFTGNRAVGGNGGNGGSGAAGVYAVGQANGGGIFSEGTLVLSGSTFTDNQAVGGSHNTGGTSGFGAVGIGIGGGLWNAGQATVTNTRFDRNEALAGSGNTGGSGFILHGTALGGGIATVQAQAHPASLTADHLTLHGNRAVGGNGNTGGPFAGAGIGGGLLIEVGGHGHGHQQHGHAQQQHNHRQPGPRR
jgi:hypothetical protein